MAAKGNLALAWLDKSSESNLSAYLAMGVNRSELAQHGLSYDDDTHLPDVDYQFLQWSEDSSAMLIYYTFTDAERSLHTGYFWYDCEDGNVYAPFPLKKEA